MTQARRVKPRPSAACTDDEATRRLNASDPGATLQGMDRVFEEELDPDPRPSPRGRGLTMDPDIERALGLDARLVEAAKQVKVLSTLEWPDDQGAKFLAAWRRKKPKLPDVRPPKVTLDA